MHVSQQTLLALLNDDPSDMDALSAVEMAHLYIESALLVSLMEFIKEQLWLTAREDRKLGTSTSYEDFIAPLFTSALSPVMFLDSFLLASGPGGFKDITRETQSVSRRVLSEMAERSDLDQKAFAVQALEEMSKHFLHEEAQQEGRAQSLGHNGPRLYRTFEGLDELFKLNYQLDRDMVIDRQQDERLYQGSGAAVQSGYSTILLALHHLNLTSGQKVVDLGSGYGRVGLVCALLRPDVEFIGLEYVPHRVDNANEACRALNLQEGLSFEVQDLSLESFTIPTADVYYLYDPFTEETYTHVLKQIVGVSQAQKVVVVTKGNARGWLMQIAHDNNWPEPLSIDEGNLCIFSSAA